MRKLLLLPLLSIALVSCGGSRPSAYVQKRGGGTLIAASNSPSFKTITPRQRMNTNQTSKSDSSNLLETHSEPSIYDETFLKKLEIIEYAKSFQGTRYKFGGTTSDGMDCSGLICTAFQKEAIALPRISRDMATEGSPISLNQVEPGDLVFFKTDNKRVINHVGLVVETEKGAIKFIHSTTQLGVIISSLEENYWKRAFVEARRII